ncbi:helix-turn-helix domain-containing protein [Haloechinothrix sp. YIM 98757]|uniref:Helix-turn-helix domain-containing protein n=1 Tax=Haloechinothrix aidingensis TaxID=2752311 RepID=A0A838AC30_9PSEU|nr:helix-turn-helix domain-containing protein [Haloechinothrix aidingensis]
MDRQVRRRLAVLRHVEKVSANVALTCRYFGISRPTYYQWCRRYEGGRVVTVHSPVGRGRQRRWAPRNPRLRGHHRCPPGVG